MHIKCLLKKWGFVILALSLFASQTFAHGNHKHRPVDEKEAMQVAKGAAEHLTTKDVGLGFGQLADSWNSLTEAELTVHKKTEDHYIIAVVNPEEKKTLYVLMSNSGEVYDVNFSGEFKGIK